MNKHKTKIFLLIFSVIQLLSYSTLTIYAQNPTFDSLANEIYRIAGFKKEKSLEILDKMYQIAYNEPDSSLFIARCLYEESLLYLQQGIINTTLKNRINKRLSKESLTLEENALLLSALGTNLVFDGKYSDAYENLLRALEKYKLTGNNRLIARTLNSLGNICGFIGLYDLAKYYFAEAIGFASPEHPEYYGIKNNIFRMLTNDEGVIDSTLNLIEILEKEKFEELLPTLYANMGTHYLDSLPEKAYMFYEKVKTLDFDNPQSKSNLFANLSTYYIIKKDFQKALKSAKEAQKIMEENNFQRGLSILYNSISYIYEQQNRLDSALHYSREGQYLTEKLNSNIIAIETHQKNITTLLEVTQKDLIIANQQNELKSRQSTIIIIVSSSIILLIFMFLLYVNQQKKRKASENRELLAKAEHDKKALTYEKRMRKLEKEKQKEISDAKIREITSYSLLVSSKNDTLKGIQELVAQIPNNKNIVQKVNNIIQNNLSAENEWDNYKMHFEKVHPHFFKNLKKKAKNLTEENLKMCAFIKMGMTTKQIANLLNVANSSIIVNRHRLKKKLKLSDKESLTNYIGNM